MDLNLEAKKVIQDIRSKHTLDGRIVGTDLAVLVGNCLEILSNQLYEKSTHFLLELVQNADDNTFACPTPTLNFSYKPGSLRVDCNEVGFSAKNIEAICGISQSTKAGKTHSGEFIGEKGIGFKSVFKAADTVWISSCEYQFKFDKAEFLGMIAPTWAEFPESIIPGYTSMYLKLSEKDGGETLVQELLAFDYNVLLFLKNIKEMNFHLAQQDGQQTKTKICKSEKCEGKDIRVDLQVGADNTPFIVRSLLVDKLPEETKRPNWSETTIRLAFPIPDDSNQALLKSQSVYAFLPIRNYNFKFLIQGDFLLTANREDVESTLPWNRTLRMAVADAFIQAVENFDKGLLRYSWPLYLPSVVTGVHGFFERSASLILKKLREMPVLESCAETMVSPSSLTYTPKQFTDRDGLLITLSSNTAAKILSPKYLESTIPALRSIGVKELSSRDFLLDLKQLISHDSDAFQKRPATWHSQLAENLIPLTLDPALLDLLMDMCLLPLEDGTWTSARGQPIFFSLFELPSIKMPRGIKVLLLDQTAEKSMYRRKLFACLGVKTLEVFEICRLIKDLHTDPNFDPSSLNRSDLVSHVTFIYSVSWQPPAGFDLWCVTSHDDRCLGSRLYLPADTEDESNQSLTASIFRKLRTRFPVLHDDYLQVIPSKARWHRWLEKSLQLSTLPRLVSPISNKIANNSGAELSDTFVLSDEFKFIFRECSSSDVLHLIVENWYYYSLWIDFPASKTFGIQTAERLESMNRLRDAISTTSVDTRRGYMPLRETVLPNIDTTLGGTVRIPALIVDIRENFEWKVLRYFDVSVTDDIIYYLRCLKAISGDQAPDLTELAHMYEQIQARYDDNDNLIRKAFCQCDIIFTSAVKSPNLLKPLGWINRGTCASRNIDIEAEYPGCEYLFRCLLSPTKNSISSSIAAVSLIDSRNTLKQILGAFKDLNTALTGISPGKAIQLLKPLHRDPVFPITSPGGHNSHGLHGTRNSGWYIADRPQLWESFHGKVPLLAFASEEMTEMEDLIRLLKLDSRRLSNIVETQRLPIGRIVVHQSYTTFLHRRRQYIKALVPKKHTAFTKVMHQINNIRVSVVTEIHEIFILKVNGVEIRGALGTGQAALTSTGLGLEILLASESILTDTPAFELVNEVAKFCEIKNPMHISLLYTAFSEENLQQVNSTFGQQGVHAEIGASAQNQKHRGHTGDIISMPSPFSNELKYWKRGDVMDGFSNVLKFDPTSTKGSPRKDGDRRLPIKIFVQTDQGLVERRGGWKQEPSLEMSRGYDLMTEVGRLKRLMYVPEDLDDHANIQYLAELMTSKTLEGILGPLYDPLRKWTSDLRSKSGHQKYDDSDLKSAFTVEPGPAADVLTAFLVEHGRSDAIEWKEMLRKARPTISLEVAATAGSRSSAFSLEPLQMERMRKYRVHTDQELFKMDNLVVLVTAYNVYEPDNLAFDYFVDPWNLFGSNLLSLRGQAGLKGTLNVPALSRHSCSFEGPTPHFSSCYPDNYEGYLYKALDNDTIRLINLFPGEPGSQLQGAIVHVPFGSAGQYRALSYVWGSDSMTNELKTPDGIVWVTDSLDVALRRLRRRTLPVILWVDAICINQEDQLEKAKQIRLLPMIFQNSSSTLAFLGPAADGSEDALMTMMQIKAKSIYGNKRDKWPKTLPLPLSWESRRVPPLDDPIWGLIGKLFDREWFQRSWILQEVVAAPSVKIVCGSFIIEWSELFGAIEIIDHEFQLSDKEFATIQSKWQPFLTLAGQREWEARHYRWSLLMLLETFRSLKATLARDRFFSLLGFAHDGNDPAFEPDYQSSLEDIVLRFAYKFVDQGRGLQLLYKAGSTSSSSRFPSWIPDWTVPRSRSLHDSSQGGPSFAASGRQEADFNCGTRSGEIITSGYVVDIIKGISKSCNVEKDWCRYFPEIDTMIDSLGSSCLRGFETLEDLKWKVPIAGNVYTKVAISGDLNLYSSYKVLRKLITKKKYEKRSEGEKGSPRSLSLVDENANPNSKSKMCLGYIAALQGTLSGWRFITTGRGFIGVVPSHTLIGDTVVIIKGGAVPFIIRQCSNSPKMYKLIGECYVHGIMKGEGLELEGVKEQSIVFEGYQASKQ